MHLPIRKSLIAQVAAALRQSIATEEFSSVLPSSRELAKDLCVSVPTVLRATKLLETEGILEIRQGCPIKILTVPSKKTQKREAESKIVAFMGFPPESIEQPSLSHAINILHRQGYTIKVPTFRSAKIGRKELTAIVRTHPTAIWVLVHPPENIQEYFFRNGLPCLVASASTPDHCDLPSMEVDFSALYRHAARQFINRGHTKFHLLICESSIHKNPVPVVEFQNEVEKAFPWKNAEPLIQVYKGEIYQLEHILERLFLVPDPPTGLLVSFVSRYMFTQCWLQQHGFQIPKDVSLISRDYDFHIECILPKPAHYLCSAESYARRLVRLIRHIAEKTSIPQRTLLISEFISGESLCRHQRGTVGIGSSTGAHQSPSRN